MSSIAVVTDPVAVASGPGPALWKQLRKSIPAQIGLAILVFIIALATIGPVFGLDPERQNLASRLLPPWWLGGGEGWLGTDQLGRDVLARLMHGARVSLFVAVLAVMIGGTLGVTLGVVAGYFGRLLDSIIMRMADVQLAFPNILLMILIVGVLGPSVPTLIAVLGVTSWVLYARVVRGQVLSIRQSEYIEAAAAIGVPDWRIIAEHVVPNTLPVVIVIASFSAAQMIIAESALSFLGLGVQPPDSSWGRMLADSRDHLTTSPWLAIAPGVAIVATVLSINLIGDWLRDVIDPRLRTI